MNNNIPTATGSGRPSRNMPFLIVENEMRGLRADMTRRVQMESLLRQSGPGGNVVIYDSKALPDFEGFLAPLADPPAALNTRSRLTNWLIFVSSLALGILIAASMPASEHLLRRAGMSDGTILGFALFLIVGIPLAGCAWMRMRTVRRTVVRTARQTPAAGPGCSLAGALGALAVAAELDFLLPGADRETRLLTVGVAAILFVACATNGIRSLIKARNNR